MLLSSSNRKYPPLPLFSYFSVVACLRCFLDHILSIIVILSMKTENLFSLILCIRMRFGFQIVFVCLYITPSYHHHYANFIWRHWTYKMPVRYNLWSVSKIMHFLSVIHYTISGAVCFQFTHSLCDNWDNIYTLTYYHNQIGSMNYDPLFKVRSWNNGMRCMSFFILTILIAITHTHSYVKLMGIASWSGCRVKSMQLLYLPQYSLWYKK